MGSGAPLHAVHNQVCLAMRRCANDEVNPMAAANNIKGVVARCTPDKDGLAMQNIWLESIAMAREWDIMDERHGRLANLMEEINHLRDSRYHWEEFEKYCPDDNSLFKDIRPERTGPFRSPPEREVLAICGFLARLVMAGVAVERLSHLAFPCIDLLEPAMGLFREPTRQMVYRVSNVVSPDRFQIADFWIHACGKRIYTAGQAVVDNETGIDPAETCQFPQMPTGTSLPIPLKCRFRNFRSDMVRTWRAWEFMFRAYVKQSERPQPEVLPPEEEKMIRQAKDLLEYMEMIESEYERALNGDMTAMEAMTSFGGI